MMLAAKYRSQDPSGMWASEKYDGWRAYWDGFALRTRTWNIIHAPGSITGQLPRGIALDGELWAGRGNFLTMQSLGQINRPSDPRWSGVRYMVFDCPTTKLIALEARLEHAQSLALGAQVQFVQQTRIENAGSMWAGFRSIVENGGEGLILRRPESYYTFDRSSDWLKVKPCNVD